MLFWKTQTRGEATLPFTVRADLLREPLKRWKVDTNYLTALWLLLEQWMGTVGTVRVVPALGPALSVQVQVGGMCFDKA